MKASLDWLKKYVDINISPDELAHKLVMAGIHVDSHEKVDNDIVFEFEITSNRSDCLSHIGIAREIAAITGKKLKMPEDLLELDVKQRSEIRIKVLADDLCPKYTACVIDNVKVASSPVWIQKKIQAIGARPVNNIVDITNYILMETGQPMHAFDKDKIKGEIIVRKAKKNEKVVTIDKVERVLEEGMLVIADEEKVIAVAGVMGALNTEVTETTKNIVLESALFEPISVRRTARLLGLSTDASYRFERSPDPDMIEKAATRALNMFKDVCKGDVRGSVCVGQAKRHTQEIDFSPAKANALLGLEISTKEQKRILEALDFEIKESGYLWKVTVPKTRRDISQAVDIVEEIIRIYGYDHIPQTIPQIIGNTMIEEKTRQIRREIKKIMSMLTCNEIVTYSLVSSELHEMFVKEKDKVAELVNALSKEQGSMTSTLLIGMLKSIAVNINRANKDLSLFEIGKQYIKRSSQDYKEQESLCIGLTGEIKDGWMSKPRKSSFFDIKGVIETLLEQLNIKDIKISKSETKKYFTTEMTIFSQGHVIGVIGEVSSEVLKKFAIKEEVFCAELDVEKMIQLFNKQIKFTPLAVYPSITRDVSLIADKSVISQKIKETISFAASKLLKSTSLVDLYKGKGIPQGKTNLVYRLEYRSVDKTLTDEEVDAEHSKVRIALSKIAGVEL
ncbi:MAG: phenylalanine--tRNA ligase subunit beta, partial [Candidatus Omnitrophica bacterium]|nr:phenylalanine--tRNA ligase subunit beta [Candidatus Omnitrophota bacterium]